MIMSRCKFYVLAVCALALTMASLPAQDAKPKSKLNILRGPAKAKLGDIAQLDVPTGYSFLDGKATRALLKAEGEPTSGQELGLLSSTNEHWSVIFEFSEVGYVRDDEKDTLNADKLLAQIKSGTEEANKERVRAGGTPLEIVGWEVPPKYDPVTHNLEWAVRATSDGRPILNYNTRLLGRKGVMEVVLIVEPDKLPTTLPTFRNLLATGYSFQTGNSYAEYRPGDKVAKYGLAALVAGGAAVGAAKLGLFSWLAIFFKKGAKLIIVALVAVASFFKKLFGRITGRREEPPSVN
jgi:uncharacterized membrane-anchored protein